MNKGYVGILGVLAALAMLVSFVPQSTPVVKAGDQQWSDITLPSIINAGKIRALAVVDSNTAFAATSNAVTAAGAATSFLVRTIDGGVTWTPVGNFDNGNGSAPTEIRGTSGSETTAPQLQATTTELYLAVSP
ncbi:MAG: hypothetical protein HYX92_02710, partial [Chloroflexi bacterium]|nr:hypothetical protein [Chloroflexota bacterium]